MYNPGPSFYMQKLVVGQAARDVIDLDAPVHVNLRLIAKALGKDTNDLVVFVLDKPRHQKLHSGNPGRGRAYPAAYRRRRRPVP